MTGLNQHLAEDIGFKRLKRPNHAREISRSRIPVNLAARPRALRLLTPDSDVR
jgi:hypothetical protein